jgi:hypothetical protein
MTSRLRWLPALVGVAYVVTVAAVGPELVRDLNWNTDISGPLALAERLRGAGPVSIPHFGTWTTYWFLLATRGLPGHADLWEALGYAFTVTAALVLGWATARVAGRWAGVTAGATALLVGPFALRPLMTLVYHVTNPFTAAVLGAYLVLLPRRRSLLLAVGVGLLAGANAASDPLLWVAGIGPFALAAGVLARLLRSRAIALRAAVMLGVTIVAAVGTNVLMHGLGYHVIGLDLKPVPLSELPGNLSHLARMAALLGGANYAYEPGYPAEPLRVLVAVLVIVAIAAPVAAALKLTLDRAAPLARAYACYWGAASVLLCLAFVVTPNARDLGPPSTYYLLTLPLAAGAGVALLGAGSRSAQLAVAFGVVVVGAVNIAGIADGRAGGSPALATYERPLVELLEREGVTRGYAGYWDAQDLSWQTRMRLLVSPVTRCTRTQLCPYDFFTIRSWYVPHPGRSFLLLDDTNNVIAGAPPFVRNATDSRRFGPLTLYLFDYDVARHVRLPPA